jgi:adenosylcobyric acid synthase
MEKVRPIMLVGTGSDVGKSMLVTGLCRLLKKRGYQPAPFKAQNMSLNSFVTPDGLEIGRAQAVQAEACGIACSADMNPILLKPSSLHKSQIVLHGKPIGDQSAREYFLGNNKENLFKEAVGSFSRLNSLYYPVVMEGAGSISELNLKHRDIVNMRMARAAGACVYLVADIDKGGVFGSVYGTVQLLEPWEKALLKGIIINKFRGDASLFESGRKQLEELSGYPVLGVVPYASDIYIEEEDSVALKLKKKGGAAGKVNIVVVLLKYLSNYTDFNVLEKDPRVHLYYSRDKEDIETADVIILPGTKNTIEDLLELRKSGLAKVILNAYQQGKKVIGICGGYQMLGESVADPWQVESEIGEVPGLGILPVRTELARQKTTVQQSFTFKQYPDTCSGYEIHMGDTTFSLPSPLNRIAEKSEGYYLDENCWGSYLHGIFDNQVVINDLLKDFVSGEQQFNYQLYKQENYDKLSLLLEQHLDVGKILHDIHHKQTEVE